MCMSKYENVYNLISKVPKLQKLNDFRCNSVNKLDQEVLLSCESEVNNCNEFFRLFPYFLDLFRYFLRLIKF